MTTDIQPIKGSSTFILDYEDVEALVKGHFKSSKCFGCDGTGWIHHIDGVVIGTGFKEDIDEYIVSEGCEECCGFGQIIKLDI